MEKHVCLFSKGNTSMKSLFGAKGVCLAEVTQLDVPVIHGVSIAPTYSTIIKNTP